MAANKFASMLHRNTNKLTLILLYTLLEWILIIFLLLNSLFSYLIVKFADYFGLQRPCIWCTRLDHVFEPEKRNFYRDLVCEGHACEISKLGFCSNHRKLAESDDMCEDCSKSKKVEFVSWLKKAEKDDDVDSLCSCCGVRFNSKLYSPYFVIKPSWEVLDYIHKGDLMEDRNGSDAERIEENRGVSIAEEVEDSREMEKNLSSSIPNFGSRDIKMDEDDEVDKYMEKEEELVKGDKHLEFMIDHHDYQLIPVELTDFTIVENQNQYNCKEVNRDFVFDFNLNDDSQAEMVNGSIGILEETVAMVSSHEIKEKSGIAEVESTEFCEFEGSSTLKKEYEDAAFIEETQISFADGKEVEKETVIAGKREIEPVVESVEECINVTSTKETQVPITDGDEVEEVAPIGGDIDANVQLDMKLFTKIHAEGPVDEQHQNQEGEFLADDNNGCKKIEEGFVEFRTISVETSEEALNNHLSLYSGLDEVEEYKFLDTPHSIDRRLSSLDSSVMCEIEGADGVMSVEKLKTALRTERKTLNALYLELEEERNAAAVAANQTMAMINRLQEEKAAMQMEALQYRKMMDEQSGYGQEASVSSYGVKDKSGIAEIESMEGCKNVTFTDNTQVPIADGDEVEEVTAIGGETKANVHLNLHEVKMLTEIHVEEPVDEKQQNQEDLSTGSTELLADENNGCNKVEEGFVELRTISVETSEEALNNHLSLYSGLDEVEEYKFPDTPHSIDRRLSSLGSSVMSEIEGDDGVMTVEKLKSALRAERKTLNAMYLELEEERNASAVAANQTMAMINRLQEEKAAMQMEALQYQRMMDEQSEYDQEALQLLNELIVKREKENQELEKELELYRKKVQDYEAKQKAVMMKSRNSSPYCSNAEDSDGLSVDLSLEEKGEDGCNGHERNNDNSNNHSSTPPDAVVYLEESLSNFEEERHSIMEQLKVLEEKLFTLSDDENNFFEDVKPIKSFYKENGNSNGNGYHKTGMKNGHFKEMNERRMDLKAKRLLPLFDAFDTDTEDETLTNGNEHVYDHELDNKRLALEVEMDQVHERLHALEADRKFLQHCIGSLKKGDKGIYLLQEILHHLRDLRSNEHSL